jgi:excisionase family DNA binding protein
MSNHDRTPAVVTGDTLRTIPETAVQLRVSRNHVYALVSRGEITLVKLGRASRVRQSAIDRLIQSGTTA